MAKGDKIYLATKGDLASLATKSELRTLAGKDWTLLGTSTVEIEIPQEVYSVAYEYKIVIKFGSAGTHTQDISYKQILEGDSVAASYYYSDTYRGMISVKLSQTKFWIDSSWSQHIYNGTPGPMSISVYWR